MHLLCPLQKPVWGQQNHSPVGSWPAALQVPGSPGRGIPPSWHVKRAPHMKASQVLWRGCPPLCMELAGKETAPGISPQCTLQHSSCPGLHFTPGETDCPVLDTQGSLRSWGNPHGLSSPCASDCLQFLLLCMQMNVPRVWVLQPQGKLKARSSPRQMRNQKCLVAHWLPQQLLPHSCLPILHPHPPLYQGKNRKAWASLSHPCSVPGIQHAVISAGITGSVVGGLSLCIFNSNIPVLGITRRRKVASCGVHPRCRGADGQYAPSSVSSIGTVVCCLGHEKPGQAPAVWLGDVPAGQHLLLLSVLTLSQQSLPNLAVHPALPHPSFGTLPGQESGPPPLMSWRRCPACPELCRKHRHCHVLLGVLAA